jgi:hypothetical protein
MNTTIKNFSKVLLLAITIFSMSIISSCSKDGEPGAPGKDGVNGTNGTNGTNANVNVISSQWTLRTFTGSGSSWQVAFAMPQITTEIINTGLLLTFRKGITGEAIQVSNQVTPYFWVYYLPGNIELEASSNQSAEYRHIFIPRASSSLERGLGTLNYSKMSYHEVCAKFNIEE